MQLTKTTTICALVLLAGTSTAAASSQKCNPDNPTTAPCSSGFTCKPLLGNTNGEGTCVAEDNSKCFMNLGQYGCKEQHGKNSHDEGCFASKRECNRKTPGKGRSLHSRHSCNPRQPFACGIFFTCKAILGNNNREGQCVPKWHPSPPTPPNSCNPRRANSCGRGQTCKPLLGNTNGEGTCVAEDNSKCFMNLGQYGCKEQHGKNSHDEGCFASKRECNDNTAGHDKSKCWMNLGQYGCKLQESKTSHDEGCFASKRECNRKTPGKNLRH